MELEVALRRGRRISDETFDQLFPDWARRPSRVHWTPVEVARRAAELLVTRPGARILDVGSGVGKFCLVGALATEGVFVGIEQRRHLVRVARQAARRLGLGRCVFLQGDATMLDWGGFDGVYLYNPFAEHLDHGRAIDRTIELAPLYHARYVHAAEDRLRDAAPGTRLATYHGFGGVVPPGWEIVFAERHRTGWIELWIRR